VLGTVRSRAWALPVHTGTCVVVFVGVAALVAVVGNCGPIV
jgi:hypothetical protein